jgi:hypothetical protein
VSPKLKQRAKPTEFRSRAETRASTPPARRGSVREPRPEPAKDAILIHGVSEDGETMAVLRAREDRVEAGLVRSVKAGQPLRGELLKLTPRPEFPLLCDVEVQVPEGVVNASGGSDDPAPARRGGPAQVATDSYRANWDAIWSKPRSSKKALAN